MQLLCALHFLHQLKMCDGVKKGIDSLCRPGNQGVERFSMKKHLDVSCMQLTSHASKGLSICVSL